MTKICKEFPEIDVEWLIFGKDKQNPSPTSKNNDNSKNNINSEVEKIILLLKDGTFKEFKN